MNADKLYAFTVIASEAKQSSQAIAGAIAGDTMSGADFLSAPGHGTDQLNRKHISPQPLARRRA
jgi:hypothetical protein